MRIGKYKPPDIFPVTSLKTIRTGILDFLFSTVVQNKFMKRSPKETARYRYCSKFRSSIRLQQKLYVKQHVQIVHTSFDSKNRSMAWLLIIGTYQASYCTETLEHQIMLGNGTRQCSRTVAF